MVVSRLSEIGIRATLVEQRLGGGGVQTRNKVMVLGLRPRPRCPSHRRVRARQPLPGDRLLTSGGGRWPWLAIVVGLVGLVVTAAIAAAGPPGSIEVAVFRWFNDPPARLRCGDGSRQPAAPTRRTHPADRRRGRPAVPDPARCLPAPGHFCVRGRDPRLPGRQRREARRRSGPAARLPLGRALPRLSDRPARDRIPVEPHGGRGRRRRRRLAVAERADGGWAVSWPRR